MLQTPAATKAPSHALDMLSLNNRSATNTNGPKSGGFADVFERQLRQQPASNQPEPPRSPRAEQVRQQDNPPSARSESRANEGQESVAAGKDLPDEANDVPLEDNLEQAIRAVLAEEEQIKPELELPDDLQAGAVLAMSLADPSRPFDAEMELTDEEMDPDALWRGLLQQRHLAAMAERGTDMPSRNSKAEFALQMAAQLKGGNQELSQAASAITQLNTPVANQQPATPLPSQMTLGHPVQQKGWDQAMSQRVVWMVRNNIQQAQIQLNPRDLGPINVRVSVQNDQATVHFIAQHATTREALDAAIPRLREMLGEAGLNLAQSDVSQQHAGSQEGDAEQKAGANGADEAELLAEDDAESLDGSHVGHIGPPGVDYFV